MKAWADRVLTPSSKHTLRERVLILPGPSGSGKTHQLTQLFRYLENQQCLKRMVQLQCLMEMDFQYYSSLIQSHKKWTFLHVSNLETWILEQGEQGSNLEEQVLPNPKKRKVPCPTNGSKAKTRKVKGKLVSIPTETKISQPRHASFRDVYIVKGVHVMTSDQWKRWERAVLGTPSSSWKDFAGYLLLVTGGAHWSNHNFASHAFGTWGWKDLCDQGTITSVLEARRSPESKWNQFVQQRYLKEPLNHHAWPIVSESCSSSVPSSSSIILSSSSSSSSSSLTSTTLDPESVNTVEEDLLCHVKLTGRWTQVQEFWQSSLKKDSDKSLQFHIKSRVLQRREPFHEVPWEPIKYSEQWKRKEEFTLERGDWVLVFYATCDEETEHSDKESGAKHLDKESSTPSNSSYSSKLNEMRTKAIQSRPGHGMLPIPIWGRIVHWNADQGLIVEQGSTGKLWHVRERAFSFYQKRLARYPVLPAAMMTPTMILKPVDSNVRIHVPLEDAYLMSELFNHPSFWAQVPRSTQVIWESRSEPSKSLTFVSESDPSSSSDDWKEFTELYPSSTLSSSSTRLVPSLLSTTPISLPVSHSSDSAPPSSNTAEPTFSIWDLE